MESAGSNTRSEWIVPDYPPLLYNDSVGKAAVEGQISHYPKVVRRLQDPPITNQVYSNISFMLYKEPRKLSNGKPVYGFVKSRGNWPDVDTSKQEAGKLIREVDSKFQIRIAPVGAWVPITEENAFVKDLEDVRMNEEEVHLRDSAIKQKMQEQRTLQNQLREREEELKSGDIYDDPSSLDFYSMKRVTEITLGEAIITQRRTLENTIANLEKVRTELKLLERLNPSYTEEWIDRYNVERRKGGIPDFIPSEKQFRDYEEFAPSEEDIKNLIENHQDTTHKEFYKSIVESNVE